MNSKRNNDKKTSRLPLIAFASLPLTVGLVLAQQTTSGAATSADPAAMAQPQRVQPIQPGQRNQSSAPQGQSAQGDLRPQASGTNYAEVFLQKLAAGLGITVEKLKAAAIAAGTATIDQGVHAGDFSADRAADMKQRLQTDPFALGGGRGGRGGHGMMRPPHDHAEGMDGGRERSPRGHHDDSTYGDGDQDIENSATTPDDGI